MFPRFSKAKQLLAGFLALLLASQLFPASSFALEEGDAAEPEEPNYGYREMPHVGGKALTDAYLSGQGESINYFHPDQKMEELPRHYDSRDYGYITPIKNQNPTEPAGLSRLPPPQKPI